MQLPAHHAFDDVGSVKFSDSAENGERDRAFGNILIIDAVHDDLLAVLDELSDDDALVRHIAGDPVGGKKVHHVEQVGFQVGSQLGQARDAPAVCRYIRRQCIP
jgi:hypothetical protein